MNHTSKKSPQRKFVAGGSLLVLAMSLLAFPEAWAALLFYDAFDYTIDERLGDASSSAYWENAKDNIRVAGGTLNYIGLQSPSGNHVNVNSGSSNLDGTRTKDDAWPSQTSGSLYFSFLLRLDSTSGIATTGTGTPIVNISQAGSQSKQLISVNLLNSSGVKVGVVKYPSSSGTVSSSAFFASGTGSNLATDGSTTYLVVARYAWVDGSANDEVTVWVNPANLGGSEDSGNKVSANTGTDGTGNAGRFTIDRGPIFGLDELRIGQTWAEVTPTDGPVVEPQPRITETHLTPAGIVLRGTNGPENGPFHVLSSTNAALPLYAWASLGSNHFDTWGSFDLTNAVPGGEAARFFRLLVGSELPPGPQGPSIVSGPVDRVVGVGQDASFMVQADGTPPLSYQWYLNTNTLLPGATNATFTIAGAQTNDAGVYSVTITNTFGMVSTNATLTVLEPPVIVSDPTNLTVNAGQPATFMVTATGDGPLGYQWYFNTNALLPDATNASFSIPSAAAQDAGAYSVVVHNPVFSVTSGVAVLTVHSAPVITVQPQNQDVIQGGAALFTVEALGSAPLYYQWYFNASNLISGATATTLTLTNVSTNDTGGYSVILTNSLGSVTSEVATLTVLQGLPDSAFDLYGFGEATTGGGVIPETNPGYVKVTNVLGFITALADKTGTIKVIEVMNDLDLGYNEAGTNVQAFSIFREHNTPLLHPVLLQTGVSKIDIQNKNGLTIFSASGATLRHGTLNIKACSNIIVRNLKFDEMWEWDETSKGDYDRNDWDFMTLGDGGGTVSGVWIDHCTFTKSYDGICDIKGGAHNITFSWCKYTGDDGSTNPNSWVWQQVNSLESNKTSHAMYNFLRTRGFSTTNIVDIVQGAQKTHLIGASADPAYAVTFHHQWFINTWDRLPRLRGGNVHNYNIYVDDVVALTARRLRDAIASTMSTADSNTLNNTYNFKPFLNGTISTEGGAILVENSVYVDNLTPLRNNQTDPSDPTYTGKIMALDSIYEFHNTDLTTTYYRGSSTNAPGDTLFGPVQAPVIPFSWNGFTSLPYSYPMDDPANLESVLQSGAGAGRLTWARTNWLKTSY